MLRVRELPARGDGIRLNGWAQDEARIGLKPVPQRTWARRGGRPVARQDPRHLWLYVYTFVGPDTGDTFRQILPAVSTEALSFALREFANAVGVGPDHHGLLVLDRAG